MLEKINKYREILFSPHTIITFLCGIFIICGLILKIFPFWNTEKDFFLLAGVLGGV